MKTLKQRRISSVLQYASVIPVVFFAVLLFLSVIYTNPDSALAFDSSTVSYADGWTYYKTGEPVSGSDSLMALVPGKDGSNSDGIDSDGNNSHGKITICKVADRDFDLNEVLCFCGEVTSFSAYADGRLLYQETNDGRDYLSHPVLHTYHAVDLSSVREGETIVLELTPKNERVLMMEYLSVGSVSEIRYHILFLAKPIVMLCVTILGLALGLFVLFWVLSAVYPLKERYAALYGSFLLAATAGWMAGENGILQLILPSDVLIYLSEDLLFMLIPAFFLFAFAGLYPYPSRSVRVLSGIALPLPLCSLLLWLIFRIDLVRFVWVYHLMILVSCVAMFRILLKGKKQPFLIAGTGCLFFSVLTAIFLYWKYYQLLSSLLFCVGFLGFLLFATVQIVRNAVSAHREERRQEERERVEREKANEIQGLIGKNAGIALLVNSEDETVRLVHNSESRYRECTDGIRWSAFLEFLDPLLSTESTRVSDLLSFSEIQKGLSETEPFSRILEAETDGRRVFLLWRFLHLPSDRKLILAFETDVTAETEDELARREDEIERNSGEAKMQFLANVSHEIRTPINAILGYGELVLSETNLSERTYRDMLHLMDAGTTLLELVNDLLDMSRIESGQFELHEEAYDLPKLLEEVKSSILPRLREKPISFTVTKSYSVPDWLYGDPVLLKQILMNLISNAVKYTEKGAVDFRVGYKDENLILSVEDTGSGIRKEDLKRIFNKFERLGNNRSHAIEGVGIGLALVKEIVGRMGGHIDVESEYGSGSTFTVTVPQKRAEEGKYITCEETTALALPDVSVLLVDDNAVNRSVMERLLCHYDLSVDCVESGEQALAILGEKKYDLLFLDHMMPGMDGIETLKELRHLESEGEIDTGGMPVIALTANAMKGMREFYFENGFDDFISKPVNLKALSALLRKWIPQDRIKDTQTAEPEEEEIPECLRNCDCIDLKTGCMYTGGYENLIRVIRIFVETHEEKAEQIARALENRDIKSYQIEVHSLKSSAQMIGAEELSEQAAYLETCAKEGEIEELLFFTTEFLRLYRRYGDLLRQVASTVFENEREGGKEDKRPSGKEVSPAVFRQELSILRQILSSYDLDNADAWAEKSSRYRIPDAWRAAFDRILNAIRAIDYEEGDRAIVAMLELIKETDAETGAV